jgi:hypothetical protein
MGAEHSGGGVDAHDGMHSLLPDDAAAGRHVRDMFCVSGVGARCEAVLNDVLMYTDF